ncbi:MAG TPA: hypothetical protein VIJ21_00625 [Solirubrobacterales bacterium]
MHVHPGGLGRLKPPDWDHVSKYPLSAIGVESLTKPAPVQLGIAWMSNFDNPVKDSAGVYWIGKGNLGTERGGHAICAQPPSLIDRPEWISFYNQGQTPECVGFSCSRGQSLEKGVEFNPVWLYNAARNFEGNHSEEGGSTVRAALHVLLKKGARPAGSKAPDPLDGVSAYRWATKWDEVRAALGLSDSEDGVLLDQSWGDEGYPPHVRLTDEAGEWLLQHEGEAGLFCER